jgi:hypothetical protein
MCGKIVIAAILASVRLGSASASTNWNVGEWQGAICGGGSSSDSGSGPSSCVALSGVHSVDGSSGDGVSTGAVVCYYASSDCTGDVSVGIASDDASCGCCDGSEGRGNPTCNSRQVVSGSSYHDCPGFYDGFESGCI